MAGDPLAIPILVGLGMDELSMNLPVVPVAKQIIRQINHTEMVSLAEEVLQLDTSNQVKQHVHSKLPFLTDLT
jgi:phosphocarrier protein FPr